MATKIHKIGNSLGLYIPKAIAQKSGFKKGTPVLLHSVGEKIIIESAVKQETLKTLLSRLNAKNRHELIALGADVGNEIIEP